MASQDGTSRNQTLASDTDSRLQTKTIFDTLARLPECSAFLQFIQSADLDYALRRSGLRTLFVPVNEAWPAADTDDADEFLTRHLLNGAFETFDLRRVTTVKTLDGSILPIAAANGDLRISGFSILHSDVPCTNGVIQVINGVLAKRAPQSRSAHV